MAAESVIVDNDETIVTSVVAGRARGIGLWNIESINDTESNKYSYENEEPLEESEEDIEPHDSDL